MWDEMAREAAEESRLWEAALRPEGEESLVFARRIKGLANASIRSSSNAVRRENSSR